MVPSELISGSNHLTASAREAASTSWLTGTRDDVLLRTLPDELVTYWLFRDGRLIYVGSTGQPRRRLLQGHKCKPWTEFLIRPAADLVEARGVEAAEILTHRPTLNEPQVQGHGGAVQLCRAAARAGLCTDAMLWTTTEVELGIEYVEVYPWPPVSRFT